MAYSKTLFFSAEFLKDNSIVDINADNKIIVRAIIEAQDLYIRPYLGTALYNKLIADGESISGNYKVLMDQYIVDCLIHWTLYILAPNQVFKWRNRSIDTQSGENSNAIGKEEIFYLQGQEKSKAEVYAKRLTDYLVAHNSLFPELNQNTGIDMQNANNTSYTVPFYLGPDTTLEDKFFA